MMKVKCKICGGTNVFMIHRGTRDNIQINVYECRKCRTKFLDINNNNDYKGDYMYSTGAMLNFSIQERIKNAYIDDKRRYERISHLIVGKSVLDFGCGFGGFLNLAKNVSERIEGVELGKIECEYLKSKNIPIVSDIDELSFTFDVITLFHVFEHLDNPRKWLRKILSHLKDGGYLIIEVPNSNDALLSLYNCDRFADFTYWSAHLFLYTIESLTILLNEFSEIKIIEADQVQRYSLANHLYWLSKGKPGGDKIWEFMNDKILGAEYQKKLKELRACDTLFFVCQKCEKNGNF